MESLQDLLSQLKTLELKIQQKISQPINTYSLHQNVNQELRDDYKTTLNIDKSYYMVTFTFQPRKIINRDFEGQFYLLSQVLEYYRAYNYYSCFEKHKSGVLHCHMLIQSEDIHTLYTIMEACKYKLTDSKFLEPAIKYKPVIKTVVDLTRAYNYIWIDKPDHPLYKYIEINI